MMMLAEDTPTRHPDASLPRRAPQQRLLPAAPSRNEIKSPLNQLERQVSIARSRSLKSANPPPPATRPSRSNSTPARFVPRSTSAGNLSRYPSVTQKSTFIVRKRSSSSSSSSSSRSLAPPPVEIPRYTPIPNISQIPKMDPQHAPPADDSESIYSFDSLASSGRLLDRLDIDKNDLYDSDGFGLSKRDSIASIQTTGRLLDRLGLDDDMDEEPVFSAPVSRDPRDRPVVNPLLNMGRQPIKKGLAAIGSYKPETANDVETMDAKVNIKKIRRNIVFENANPSADSIVADVATIKKTDNHVTFKSDQPLPPLPNLKRSLTVANGEVKNPGSSALNYPPGHSNSDEDLPIPGSSRLPVEITRTPSAPVIRTTGSYTSDGHDSSKTTRRVVSEGNKQIPTSNNSHSNIQNIQASTDPNNLSPETRIKLANQLRTMGKHREASYQLQISANSPNNYPKAMYQYAIALRAGQGVKQNDRHCIKWLCKCILIDSHSVSHPQYPFASQQVSKLADKLNQLQPEDLIKLILKQLEHTLKSDPLKHGAEPNLVYDAFTKLSKTQVNKVAIVSKNQADVVAMSYHELGKTLFNGWGLNNKDEVNGIKLLSMAGSMGNVYSMIELGEIWSSKTKYHKKDFYKAAAWLRSSEIFGFKSIGNSWIYKDKYLSK